MRVAVYPGSFDPPTHGHLNIIERGAHVFDEVVVTIATNTSKKGVFTPEERMDLIRQLTKHLPNVRVEGFTGLLVDFMSKKDYHVVLRGIRTVQDFEYEFQMALSNKHLNPDIETVFMMTDAKYSHLSSSLIREIVMLGGSTKGMVPEIAEKALREKLSPKK
ncbi:MAG: pantetheine-phosphate adenylyltransferase [Bdellovibrionota bacterium]